MTDEKNTSVPQEYTYATLMETSGEESESWYYFIRYQGNEDALKHLNDQLEKVDWYVLDDLSTFDLEMNYLISEKTAKEMTKVDLNHTSFHRKFNGKLEKIDLRFTSRDKNDKKIKRVNDVLSYGKVEKYIGDEDIDPEDLTEQPDENENDSEPESSESSSDKTPEKRKGIPESVLNSALPKFAKAKQHRKKKH